MAERGAAPAIGSTLIIAYADATLVQRALSLPPVRWIGSDIARSTLPSTSGGASSARFSAMVRPVTVALPTVRDADGLALSSRNRFLSAEERALAGRFPAVLGAAADALQAGAPVDPALADARAELAGLGFAVDYLDLVHAVTLERLDAVAAPSRLIAAARLGSVRLLDNFAVA